METYQGNALDERAGGQSRKADDLKDPNATVWVSAAQKRQGGQIGDGLLHNIELRLGSIA